MNDPMDWATLTILISMLGSGVWKIYESFVNRGDRGKDRLERRAKEYDEKYDARLKQLEVHVEQCDRVNAAVLGTLTILLDRHIFDPAFDPAIALIGAALRDAFPAEAEIPEGLKAILRRLDAREIRIEP